MSRGQKQAVITCLFIGLLIFVALRGSGESLWNRIGGGDGTSASSGGPRATPLERYGFHFTESAKEAGIGFQHHAPTLDAKLAHIMPLVNPMGAAAAVLDYDADGWLDLYFVTSDAGGQNALFRNKGDGTFEETAVAMGVADLNQPGTGACMGAVAADYDNDGYPDLLVYRWGRPELFRNIEGKRFERVTEGSGLPAWMNANAACWLDYNRDGRLDLFLAGYWPDNIDLWNLSTTRIMPESFEFATNGGGKVLLKNLGDGKFENVTKAVGIESTRWTLGVVSADLDGNGYPDLVLANDYGVSEFFANRGGERFEEVGYASGIGVTPKSGMSASLGDPLNEGRQSVYITNITEPGNLVQGNNLWVPIGELDEEAGRGVQRYLNQAGTLNIERGGWSWGAKFADLNNDGWLDLFQTNGYISAAAGKSYWYDYGKIAGGLKGLIGDAKFWPPIGDQSLAGFQTKCVWLNKGGDFTDVCAAVGVTETNDGRAVALADLSNRGVIDVVVASQNGKALLYRNTVAEGQDWIQFQLTGGARPEANAAGRPAQMPWSNRSAVGAEVVVIWRTAEDPAPRRQQQVVTAGDAYASQSMLRLHFGLGKSAVIEEAVVTWPSGRTTVLKEPAVRTLHRLDETDSKEPTP